jgi:NTE family protein
VRARGRAALGAAWPGRRTNRLASWLAVAFVAAVLAGCSYPTRNTELASLDPRDGYRWGALAGGELEDTIFIFTASGGGTRATALALSTLRGLERLKLDSGRSLADEIDVVSSVSGGSVTAGYFALTGTGGFDRLERDFVRRDGMSALIWKILNPVDLIERATPSRERIDLLIDYLDETLFDEATFADLRRAGRRPLLILNAADMVEGTPFPFTQNRFDLICSDLGRLKLSVGVAASAAVPGAMTPLTLVNYSPCEAQESASSKNQEPVSWKEWVTNAADSNWYDNPARVRRGRVAESYALGRTVPPPEGKFFIHLLDGGIADNLGVAEPFRLLSTNEVSPNFFNQISQGKIRRIVFVLVNARSAKASELNGEIATPGITAMLGATIDAAIDNATFGNFQRLETLLRERLRAAAAEMPEPLAGNFKNVETFFLPVDFDAIEDDGCRRAFQSIATRWTLREKEIDALMIAGQALLKSAPKLTKVANSLGVTGIENLPELEDACAAVAKARR